MIFVALEPSLEVWLAPFEEEPEFEITVVLMPI